MPKQEQVPINDNKPERKSKPRDFTTLYNQHNTEVAAALSRPDVTKEELLALKLDSAEVAHSLGKKKLTEAQEKRVVGLNAEIDKHSKQLPKAKAEKGESVWQRAGRRVREIFTRREQGIGQAKKEAAKLEPEVVSKQLQVDKLTSQQEGVLQHGRTKVKVILAAIEGDTNTSRLAIESMGAASAEEMRKKEEESAKAKAAAAGTQPEQPEPKLELTPELLAEFQEIADLSSTTTIIKPPVEPAVETTVPVSEPESPTAPAEPEPEVQATPLEQPVVVPLAETPPADTVGPENKAEPEQKESPVKLGPAYWVTKDMEVPVIITEDLGEDKPGGRRGVRVKYENVVFDPKDGPISGEGTISFDYIKYEPLVPSEQPPPEQGDVLVRHELTVEQLEKMELEKQKREQLNNKEILRALHELTPEKLAGLKLGWKKEEQKDDKGHKIGETFVARLDESSKAKLTDLLKDYNLLDSVKERLHNEIISQLEGRFSQSIQKQTELEASHMLRYHGKKVAIMGGVGLGLAGVVVGGRALLGLAGLTSRFQEAMGLVGTSGVLGAAGGSLRGWLMKKLTPQMEKFATLGKTDQSAIEEAGAKVAKKVLGEETVKIAGQQIIKDILLKEVKQQPPNGDVKKFFEQILQQQSPELFSSPAELQAFSRQLAAIHETGQQTDKRLVGFMDYVQKSEKLSATAKGAILGAITGVATSGSVELAAALDWGKLSMDSASLLTSTVLGAYTFGKPLETMLHRRGIEERYGVMEKEISGQGKRGKEITPARVNEVYAYLSSGLLGVDPILEARARAFIDQAVAAGIAPDNAQVTARVGELQSRLTSEQKWEKRVSKGAGALLGFLSGYVITQVSHSLMDKLGLQSNQPQAKASEQPAQPKAGTPPLETGKAGPVVPLPVVVVEKSGSGAGVETGEFKGPAWSEVNVTVGKGGSYWGTFEKQYHADPKAFGFEGDLKNAKAVNAYGNRIMAEYAAKSHGDQSALVKVNKDGSITDTRIKSPGAKVWWHFNSKTHSLEVSQEQAGQPKGKIQTYEHRSADGRHEAKSSAKGNLAEQVTPTKEQTVNPAAPVKGAGAALESQEPVAVVNKNMTELEQTLATNAPELSSQDRAELASWAIEHGSVDKAQALVPEKVEAVTALAKVVGGHSEYLQDAEFKAWLKTSLVNSDFDRLQADRLSATYDFVQDLKQQGFKQIDIGVVDHLQLRGGVVQDGQLVSNLKSPLSGGALATPLSLEVFNAEAVRGGMNRMVGWYREELTAWNNIKDTVGETDAKEIISWDCNQANDVNIEKQTSGFLGLSKGGGPELYEYLKRMLGPDFTTKPGTVGEQLSEAIKLRGAASSVESVSQPEAAADSEAGKIDLKPVVEPEAAVKIGAVDGTVSSSSEAAGLTNKGAVTVDEGEQGAVAEQSAAAAPIEAAAAEAVQTAEPPKAGFTRQAMQDLMSGKRKEIIIEQPAAEEVKGQKAGAPPEELPKKTTETITKQRAGEATADLDAGEKATDLLSNPKATAEAKFAALDALHLKNNESVELGTFKIGQLNGNYYYADQGGVHTLTKDNIGQLAGIYQQAHAELMKQGAAINAEPPLEAAAAESGQQRFDATINDEYVKGKVNIELSKQGGETILHFSHDVNVTGIGGAELIKGKIVTDGYESMAQGYVRAHSENATVAYKVIDKLNEEGSMMYVHLKTHEALVQAGKVQEAGAYADVIRDELGKLEKTYGPDVFDRQAIEARLAGGPEAMASGVNVLEQHRAELNSSLRQLFNEYAAKPADLKVAIAQYAERLDVKPDEVARAFTALRNTDDIVGSLDKLAVEHPEQIKLLRQIMEVEAQLDTGGQKESFPQLAALREYLDKLGGK